MASITSVISIFVLLLVTYSYAVPIGQKFDISTSNYEFTTAKTLVEHEMKTDIELTTFGESTIIPVTHTKRTSSAEHSGEYTSESHIEDHHHEIHSQSSEDLPFTTSPIHRRNKSSEDSSEETSTMSSEKHHHKSHPKRTIEDDSFTTSENVHHLSSLDEDSFTTLESSIKFNSRAFPKESQEEVDRRAESEHDLEMTTFIESLSTVEPESHTFETTSSVDSFGKSTGLLHDDKSEEKFTTVEYEDVSTSERPTTSFPVDSQRLTQSETIIPGKITETKIFANVPSRTYVVDQPVPVKQTQLSEDPSRPIVEKKMPDN